MPQSRRVKHGFEPKATKGRWRFPSHKRWMPGSSPRAPPRATIGQKCAGRARSAQLDVRARRTLPARRLQKSARAASRRAPPAVARVLPQQRVSSATSSVGYAVTIPLLRNLTWTGRPPSPRQLNVDWWVQSQMAMPSTATRQHCICWGKRRPWWC